MFKLGLDQCVFVGSSLVDMYGKCVVLGDATKVFDGMIEKNVVAWNSMIASYVQNGFNQEAIKVFYDMRFEGIEPTRATVSGLLSASAKLCGIEEGKQGHAIANLNGLELDSILGSSVVNFYAKAGLFEDAELLFDRMVEKDVVTWNLSISSYVRYGLAESALSLCYQMRIQGFMFDSVTLSSILTAAADMRDLGLSKDGNCYCIKKNFVVDVVVASCIVDMYAKCQKIEDARLVFDSTAKKDLVLWNAMLGSYAELGLSGKTLKVFYQMHLESVPPNVVSWNSIILEFLRNGQVNEAIDMFSQMIASHVQPNLITYTAMISGLSQIGLANEEIMIVQQMLKADFQPNTVTIASALSACACIPSLGYGRAIHGCLMRQNFPLSVSLAATLVDMYAKCGCLKQAKHIFDMILIKLPLYNAMISSYALHGCSKDALALYKNLEEGIKPDEITFTNVLSAWSKGGLVDEGFGIIKDIISLYSLKPNIEHNGCVITLLSRHGNFNEILELIQTMPIKPDACLWGSLLAAGQELNETELGEHISDYLIRTEPTNAGDRSHSETEEIYATLALLHDEICFTFCFDPFPSEEMLILGALGK